MNAKPKPKPKPKSFVSFKALKDRVTMEDILRHYGLLESLKPRGNDSLSGVCPLHEGANPTQFRVSPSKNCWNCFGCGKGGNMLDFVVEMEQKPIREAAMLVQAWFPEGKAPLKREAPPQAAEQRTVPEQHQAEVLPATPRETEPVAEPVEPPINQPLPFQSLKNLDHWHPYLREQGFDHATMEHFGVGYCGKGIHAGRIAIPVHNREGLLVAYVGCSVDDGTYAYPEGFRRDGELYNLHRVKERWSPTDGVLLVHDFFDVFRLYEASYQCVVGLMGEVMSPWQAQALTEAFPEGTTIRLFGERQSGWALPIAERLLHSFRIHIVWPERNGISPQDLSTDQIWEILNP